MTDELEKSALDYAEDSCRCIECKKKEWDKSHDAHTRYWGFEAGARWALERAAKVAEDAETVYEGCRGNYEVDTEQMKQNIAKAIRDLMGSEKK